MGWRHLYILIFLVVTATASQLATEATLANSSIDEYLNAAPSSSSVLEPRAINLPLGSKNDSDVCPDEDCRIPGQPDLYGVGTRVGIYALLTSVILTWAASLIANNVLPSEYDDALDNNTVFLFALTVAVIFYAKTSQLRTLDVLVLLQLGLGFIATVMTVWGYRTCVYWREGAAAVKRFGGVGTHVRLVILSAISGFSLWFWSVGYKDDSLRNCKFWRNCHTDLRVFVPLLFHTYDLHSETPRVFYMVFSAALSLYYLCMLIAVLAGILWRCAENPFLCKPWNCWPSLDGRREFYTRFKRWQFKTINWVLAFLNIIGLSFSIAGIEMTLKRNQVKDVGRHNIASYGQLLPLSIGALAMAKVAIDIVLHYCIRREKLCKRPDILFKEVGDANEKDDDGFGHRLLAACLPWTLLWRDWDQSTGSESWSSTWTSSSSGGRARHDRRTRVSYQMRKTGRRR